MIYRIATRCAQQHDAMIAHDNTELKIDIQHCLLYLLLYRLQVTLCFLDTG